LHDAQVYNISGFKQRKGENMSAANLAKFLEENIKWAAGQEYMYKKSTVDNCITLHERFFSIPECEAIVKFHESAVGPDSAFNSLYKLVEIIYRLG